jgi:hypothetical protein
MTGLDNYKAFFNNPKIRVTDTLNTSKNCQILQSFISKKQVRVRNVFVKIICLLRPKDC